jgi:hypothetical protein
MGILDEAIREHLELKRQHGVGDDELKQLEDDAFGPPERPSAEASDSLAEAPTEFMAAEPSGPSTEEREAIADQPTEMFDVEGEIAASEEGGPSDEQLVEEEMSEPRLAPVDPLAGLEEGGEVEVSAAAEEEIVEDDEDDDFWDEQRLSDELNQALEAPVDETEAELEVEEEEEIVIEEEIVEEVDEEPADDEADSAPQDREDEDILEDTPDFLEDSEDDQLWFEQKPPKDFDFDD